MENWNAEALSALVGVILSLVFAYVPGVKEWFEELDSRFKPLVMAGLLLLASAGYLLYSCRIDWACIQANAGTFVMVFFYALMGNIGAHVTVVKQIKQAQWEAEYLDRLADDEWEDDDEDDDLTEDPE